ncbi:uracil-DNA glycosylase [Nevskia sp.]|uniref:uracil-DNA glycosylase n=1 Tax=Nevskia sp. TaxID=1929292 RepID=UPI0025D2F4DA|nr:uracil-DNA glycosylase [Nevskia sp.]
MPDLFDVVHAALSRLPTLPGSFNPWTQANADDAPGNGPARRLAHLRAHAARPGLRLVLIGEAAGYQGCRVSGIPFTSEALLIDGSIPGIAATPRLSTRPKPWSEPSARVVWRTLHAQRLAESTFLWNAFPLHPHAPGEPLSNRTPTRGELAAGESVLAALRMALPDAVLAAVGNKSSEALTRLGYSHVALRHPAYGGVTEFAAGVERLAATLR